MFPSDGSLQSSQIFPKQEIQEVFTLELCQWVVIGAQPFSVVEGEYFKRLVKTFKTEHAILSRFTIARRISGLDDYYKLRMMDMSERLPGMVGLTADASSSIVYRSYIQISDL